MDTLLSEKKKSTTDKKTHDSTFQHFGDELKDFGNE